MSASDRRIGERAAWLSWVAKGCPVAPPELTIIPPCRDCGKVPRQYSRFHDGTVQCAGDNRRDCEVTHDRK